ncbi:hypothetical protein PC41400_16440 [Paenibacillus chitinolyticus]|uniref:DUF2269 domain-containing protein n=1 Tax=Paenibacillus chitinolyticus TaxID=79263 RepID=A0A410WXY1_9BACL|nr:hypothetical protein [Paenibacillus chitinolyticus]MCY9589807.1 hypothetical protein [Paenibacillus chitinolyticus]MCY9598192.1 hypothetical protein [Paenibacillus chitinolyticus]QAV19183.1 hypothetical protein PC41400_16440 [Paenibacillus chitinolyticus]
MFGWMLFLHITGLLGWLGALLGILVTMLLLRKQLGTSDANSLAGKTIRVFGRIAHPSSILVLLSGVYLILQMGIGTDKPLWLQVMEKGGGTIILLAVIFTSVLGSKMNKRLNSSGGTSVRLTGYLSTVGAFMFLIVSVVLVVSLKL